jgi:hypothetical protein
MRRFQSDQKVDMISHTADLEGHATEATNDPAEVGMNTFANVVTDRRLAPFCTEDKMVVKTHMRRGHHSLLCRPSRADLIIPFAIRWRRFALATGYRQFAPPARGRSASCQFIFRRTGRKVDQGTLSNGVSPHEIAIVVRSDNELPRDEAATKCAAVAFLRDDKMETRDGRLSIAMMHLAKGLEFSCGRNGMR